MSSVRTKAALFSSKRYNAQAEEVARKITSKTNERFATWLVSMKYLVDQDDVDSVLSLQGKYCDSVIFEEHERVTENQRILLQCEKQRVMERQAQVEERQQVLDKVVTRVAITTEKMLVDRLSDMEVPKLLWGFPDFGHFASFAYSASLNFSKLGSLTTLSHSLRGAVLELVGTAKFCEALGKSPKYTNDPKVAIGMIGIDNCRKLFPVLMARPLLRWADNNTKLIAPKLWQHMVVTANVTRMRLHAAGYKEPDEGIFLGVIRSIAIFSVVNYFNQIFEDSLVEVMQNYREKEEMDEYFACSEVKPTMSVLPRAIYKLEKKLTRNIVEHIEWDQRVAHLRMALMEDLDDVPILERSVHAVALGQARAYSIYDLMQRSNAFVEKHKPFWFANVQLDGVALKEIEKSNPGRLTLSI
ncbi:HDOD domain-containing protein [Vibrio hannami]|uniref:HDOD domain-containing protein n=1 Tax=Vibrio hannami TaxID=2717094 RepID=UPI00240FFF66|nr:HDOD domain-containing protein [Vibrio hannami]MDG3088317.1 HDOD domain-containing protein [Vibrio hannami]